MIVCTIGSFVQTFVFGVFVALAFVVAVFMYRKK